LKLVLLRSARARRFSLQSSIFCMVPSGDHREHRPSLATPSERDLLFSLLILWGFMELYSWPLSVSSVSISPVGSETKLASTSTTKGSVPPTHRPRQRPCREFSPSFSSFTVACRESFQRSYPRRINYRRSTTHLMRYSKFIPDSRHLIRYSEFIPDSRWSNHFYT
jgi:hypothetical protein